MNYKNKFQKIILVSMMLLSSSLLFCMEQDNNIENKNNNLLEKFEKFNELPTEIQKEVLDYIFNSSYLDSLSLDELEKVFNLKTLNKKFKNFICINYKQEFINKKDKLGLELIKSVRDYKVLESKLESESTNDEPLENIKKLIELGANLNKQGEFLYTALMWAVENGHDNIAQWLIKPGVNVNLKGLFECVPLVIAIVKTDGDKRVEIIKLLIDAKADVNVKTSSTEMVLLLDKKRNVPKSILENACKLKIGSTIYDFTPLMWASVLGNTSILKLLIDNGSILDTKNNLGTTALDIAKEFKEDEAVILLEDAMNKKHNKKIKLN